MKHKLLFFILIFFMLVPLPKVEAFDFCVITVSDHSFVPNQDADGPMWSWAGVNDVMVMGTTSHSVPSVLSCRQCSVDGCWILKALQSKYSRSCYHGFFEKNIT